MSDDVVGTTCQVCHRGQYAGRYRRNKVLRYYCNTCGARKRDNKYEPHQGKQECQRRAKRNEQP